MAAIGAYADPTSLDAVDAQIAAGATAAATYDANAAAARRTEMGTLQQQFTQNMQEHLSRLTELQGMQKRFMDAATPKPTLAADPNMPAWGPSSPGAAVQPSPAAVPVATSGGGWQKDVGGNTPAQYDDPSLSPAEANAACGPAAAVAFARANGREPTLREATDLAKQLGWTTEGGMNGIANEKALMDKLQIPNHLEGTADWNKIAQDANGGNPVVVSTPQHYFVIDGQAGNKFHVGNSGTAVQSLGGSEWMTRGQIESVGRGVNGVLYSDHPQATGPSIAEDNNGSSPDA